MKIKLNKGKSAFTLIELLIASSILMIIITLSVEIFFNITRAYSFLEQTDILDRETKLVLERLSQEIQSNTIDYPEYYNYYVLNNGGEDFDQNNGDTFGSNYSVYGARFYNPGYIYDNQTVQGANYSQLAYDDLGAWCEYANNKFKRITTLQCNGKQSLEYTEDFVTGTNPYTSGNYTFPNQASAMCDSTSEMHIFSKKECTGNATDHLVDTLFLISPDGHKKTIIGKESVKINSSDYVDTVSLVKMDGSDEDNDGVNENWVCEPNYLCTKRGGEQPNVKDINPDEMSTWNTLWTDFVPISSLNINITDLRFYIAPIEDPHKAFEEFDQKIQPYVTIIMTAELKDPRAQSLPESQRSITLQSTISTQFYGEIDSYLGTR